MSAAAQDSSALLLIALLALGGRRLSQEGRSDHRDRRRQGADRGRHRSAIRWLCLPGGMVGLAYVDARSCSRSQFGQKLLTIARARSPVPESAGFDPARDLKHAYVGFYSIQGADIAAVATGNFDKDKIERAAESTQKTPLGVAGGQELATPVARSTPPTTSDSSCSHGKRCCSATRPACAGRSIGSRRAGWPARCQSGCSSCSNDRTRR